MQKTGRVVTVEDGFPQSGIGAEIIGVINDSTAFDSLLRPVQRVTGIDIPMAYAEAMESHTVPKTDTIIQAVRNLL